MRQLKPYTLPGLRKQYVDRGELEAYLSRHKAKKSVQKEKAA